MVLAQCSVQFQCAAQLSGGYLPEEGRGDSYVKMLGLFVVSLRGINHGFWPHLECSGGNAIISVLSGNL